MSWALSLLATPLDRPGAALDFEANQPGKLWPLSQSPLTWCSFQSRLPPTSLTSSVSASVLLLGGNLERDLGTLDTTARQVHGTGEEG